MPVPHILGVNRDDTTLILHFSTDQLPDLTYINQTLLESLKKGYDNNICMMLKSYCTRGTINVPFYVDDKKHVSSDEWDALCTILDEYIYTLKDARTIIKWLDDCVQIPQSDHVYVGILEGASDC